MLNGYKRLNPKSDLMSVVSDDKKSFAIFVKDINDE
jgi:hypothetical protein